MKNLRDIVALVVIGVLISLIVIWILVSFATQEMRHAEPQRPELTDRATE